MTNSGFTPLHFLSAIALFTVALVVAPPLAAQRSDRPGLDISGYVIDAEIDTTTHHLTAKVTVAFTAPESADLIRKSAKTASARLQFCRLAFGAAGSGPHGAHQFHEPADRILQHPGGRHAAALGCIGSLVGERRRAHQA